MKCLSDPLPKLLFLFVDVPIEKFGRILFRHLLIVIAAQVATPISFILVAPNQDESVGINSSQALDFLWPLQRVDDVGGLEIR